MNEPGNDYAGTPEPWTGDSQPGPDWRGFGPRLARLLVVSLVVFLMLLGVAATLGGVAARQWWIAELTTHFKIQLAVALAVCALVLALMRSYGFALLALLAAAVNLAFVGLLYLPAPDPSRYDSRNLRLLFAHLDRTSADYEAVASLVRKEAPDIVMFNEVSSAWLAGLAPLNEAYPHRVAVPRDDEHGVAVLSRLPLGETVTSTIGSAALPAIVTQAMLDDIPISLLTAHPPMPSTAELAAERNRQFDQLATLARSRKAPEILCADLSTGPWSPYFVDLLDGTGLRNARQSFGIQATWNANWPRLMTLPIDHCLTSPDIAVRSLRRGPRVGSDHLPLIADLSVSKP